MLKGGGETSGFAVLCVTPINKKELAGDMEMTKVWTRLIVLSSSGKKTKKGGIDTHMCF